MGTEPVTPVLHRPPRWRRAPSSAAMQTGMVALGGAGLALLAAVAWILLRDDAPSVDAALVLVAATTLVGLSGRRSAVVGAAAGSACGFTYFDTEPYEHFAITRGPDIVTAVLLVVVGLATGELALRVMRQRRFDRGAGGGLGRVREAADRLAHGQELVVMIGAVADQITTLLGVADCTFSTEEEDAELPFVDRDGTMQASPSGVGGPSVAGLLVALPVLSQGVVVGRYVLRAGPSTTWAREHLLVAVTLADQVGAALAAQAPPIIPPDPPPSIPPLGDPPVPRLRVIR